MCMLNLYLHISNINSNNYQRSFQKIPNTFVLKQSYSVVAHGPHPALE